MIFVTVGTHEQQFNRLIQKVDEKGMDILKKMYLCKLVIVHINLNIVNGSI